MTPPLHLASAHISLKNIARNFNRMHRHSVASGMAECPPAVLFTGDGGTRPFRWPSQMGVVKGDAYGHGHIQVCDTLWREGASVFVSGNAREAVELRLGLRALPGAPSAADESVIISLLGPICPEDVRLCRANAVVPVIHFHEQFDMLEAAPGPLAVAIKCNTGMGRLGFDPEEMHAVAERLSHLRGVEPVLAISHLHSSDSGDPTSALEQAEVFAGMLAVLRSRWPRLAASICNSAGTLFAGEVTERIGPHICRPGVTLYGINPFAGTPLAHLETGLTPAMAVSAPIIAERDIPVGGCCGYGRAFVAETPTRAGIVGVGYADFYSRGLSGRASMCVEGVRTPVLGRISMQMTGVDLTPVYAARARSASVNAGDNGSAPRTAWMLGGPYENAVTPDELAAVWGTIPYEVMYLLGNNNREYVD